MHAAKILSAEADKHAGEASENVQLLTDIKTVFSSTRPRPSALIAGGASVKRVSSILGHASPAVTLGVYSHLWPDDDDRARTILDAALADCVRTREVVG
jgi:integrase